MLQSFKCQLIQKKIEEKRFIQDKNNFLYYFFIFSLPGYFEHKFSIQLHYHFDFNNL